MQGLLDGVPYRIRVPANWNGTLIVYANPVGLPERGQNLYFAFAVRAELERRAGGPAAENVGRVYTLGDDDKAYLGGLGVNADALLAEMNDMTNITSDRNARNYAARYFDPSGDIRRPVLTVHTTGDALAPPNHESAYCTSVGQLGNGDLLMQQFTAGYRTPSGTAVNGHCTFTSAQNVAGIDAMVNWLDTGNRPEAFFPATLDSCQDSSRRRGRGDRHLAPHRVAAASGARRRLGAKLRPSESG